MTATKISELTSTTTPASSVELAVVESSTTKRTTLAQAISSVLGWFNVEHNGSDQTSIGTTETQLLNDAAGTSQGGYSYLPNGVSSSDVYDNTDSRIKLGWLTQGQAVAVSVYGDLTTSSADTGSIVTIKVFDSSDTEVASYTTMARFIKSASGSNSFFAVFTPIHITSAMESDGYIKAYVQFDTGASNEVADVGFNLSVLA